MAPKKPEIFAQRKQAYDSWNAELVEPLWKPNPAAQKKGKARRAQQAAKAQ
jgi:hypothetical protein